MKNLSLILASLVLFASASFAHNAKVKQQTGTMPAGQPNAAGSKGMKSTKGTPAAKGTTAPAPVKKVPAAKGSTTPAPKATSK